MYHSRMKRSSAQVTKIRVYYKRLCIRLDMSTKRSNVKTEVYFLVYSSLCMRLLFFLSPGYCFTAEEGMKETEQQQHLEDATTMLTF